GSIVITETNAITLTDVDTQNGLITFITGGNLTALDVQSLTDNDANDITFTATGNIAFDLVSGNGTSTTGATAGDVFMTASGSIEENIADAGPDLIGDNSILIANGGSIGGVVDIESALNTLTAHSNAAGAIVFNEVNAIQLDDIDTANGLITFNAGGTISAVDVQSLTDADVNDVTLNSTGGDILVNFVSAGPLNGDLLFLATVGNINELGSDGAVDLIGDNNILTAGSSIGIPANGIETTFNILDASSTNTGSIVLNETDIITLLDIDTANGLITIIAGNTITALDVQSLNDIGGNNVTLTANTGDVLVDFVSAGILANNLTITATTGNIRDFNGDGAVDLQANAAILTAAGDIGGNLTGNLDTTFNTLNATSTVFGPVYINETDDIRLINVTTANGWIDTLAGGGIIAVNVVSQTDSQFNSIKLISVAGNIEVGLVSAGTSFGDVLIWAKNGAVDEYVIEDPVADIVADDLILFASSGIGDNREIELSVRSFTVAAINGNISLGNITPFNVTINSISTVNGNIKFTQSGGADLTVLNASTGVGNITFNVQDNQDLYMYNLIAGGNTTLIADEIDLLGGPLSIQSRFNTGILTMRPNDPSLTTHVYSPVDRTVFRDSNVLEIGWQDIRAFEFSYLKFVVGNILTNQNPIAIEYLSQINTVLLAFVGFTDSDVFDDAEVDELIFNFSGIMNTNISFLKGELNRNNFVDAGGLVIEAITLPFVFNDDDSLGDPLYTFNGDSNAQNGDDTNENSDETPKKSKIKNTDEKSEDNLNGNGEGGENSQPDDTTFNQFEGSDELAHEAAPSLLSVEGMASTLTMVAMTVGQVVAGIFRK
ncbi:MAG: hypothetical protein SGI71_10495, partial [Verrucomicrobiota bacterium]|nr:hypothetical protein [Verrucomicrobiota bacterium]